MRIYSQRSIKYLARLRRTAPSLSQRMQPNQKSPKWKHMDIHQLSVSILPTAGLCTLRPKCGRCPQQPHTNLNKRSVKFGAGSCNTNLGLPLNFEWVRESFSFPQSIFVFVYVIVGFVIHRWSRKTHISPWFGCRPKMRALLALAFLAIIGSSMAQNWFHTVTYTDSRYVSRVLTASGAMVLRRDAQLNKP